MPSEPGDLALIQELGRRLDEATDTLEAIQSGNVDAVVVNGPHGPRVFTLESPDYPFRTLVERMQEGALTLHRDGTIIYANSFLGTLLGRQLADIIGAPLRAFVTPGYEGMCSQLIEQGLLATVKQSLRVETPSGSIPVQLTLSPLSSGDAPTCCGLMFDLREREHAERARAAREVAEAANAAKDRFLAVLGHELRSPLNTVLGWAQILSSRSDLDASALKAVRTIERNARAQAQLISELLDVSRVIAGKLHLQFEVVDARAVIAAVIASTRLTLDKRLEIADDLGEGDAFVLGDSTRLQQVITNLLGNAVKFTDEGGRIEVRLLSGERHLQVRVTDTGAGIDPDQLDIIFEVFQQAPLGQRKGGLGLGLSITKQLVEAHGGQIRVTSAGSGRGSTFTVTLPRVHEPLPTAEEDRMIETRLTDCRILVIDDDADILELMRYALEHRGARVDTVQSAAAALERLATSRYDVLVSDVGLPERDGLSLMREVRARGQNGSAPRAVALTGFGSKDDAQRCASAGFELHLVKPISPWEVARAITQLLERPRAAQP